MNVSAYLSIVPLSLDEHGFESTLEKVTDAVVTPVEIA
jgi:hypothetical protein